MFDWQYGEWVMVVGSLSIFLIGIVGLIISAKPFQPENTYGGQS